MSVLNEGKNILNGLNLYIYCLNNPVNDIDSTGNWSWKKFWETLVTIVVSVAVVVAITTVTVASGGSSFVVLMGAGLGSVSSGISSVISQVASGNNFSFSQLLIDMSFGAITGAIGGSNFGLFGVTVGNTLSGFASSVVSDCVQGEKVNWGKAGISAIASLISGLVSGAGAQNGITDYTKQLMNSASKIKTQVASSREGKNMLSLMYHQIINSRDIEKK